MISPHVGGGFGSKGTAAPARGAGRDGREGRRAAGQGRRHPPADVRLTGYRTPTIQRLRLGADADGRLTAIATRRPSRPRRLEGVRRADRDLLALDVRGAQPPHRRTGWSRSTCRRRRGCARPASARACTRSSRRWTSSRVAAGIDPIELRIRNEPDVHPETGQRFSSRNLVACLREGAERFGWERRGEPGARRDGRWLHGMGVAALDLPRLPDARRRRRVRAPPRRRLRRAHRGRRHRHRRAHRAHPDRRRRARGPARPGRGRGRRQRLPRAERGRRLDRAPPRGGRRSCWPAARCASSSTSTAARCRRTASRRPPTPATSSSRASSSPATRSARSSPTCASTPPPARCACRACSACSPPGASSTRARRARS